LPGAVLFVANHVSWVDIEVMHSQRMMGFVAKREIAGWPVVGWLARGRAISTSAATPSRWPG
jgi:1-acyl-sn-glycerol-3-phosphate acyltransferase